MLKLYIHDCALNSVFILHMKVYFISFESQHYV
ncbi:hypothetical protein PANA5342_pPANA10049 (plasmid) [Pantoea ananatis LMG 5342]|nr:hypothetical protein PANA5342_pPANA10049 [Pantoea ananatis LMG 5342]